MKTMKVLALVSVIALVSADAYGGDWFKSWRQKRQQRQIQETQRPAGKPVGAPIDGGLLALLGAAGIAYYGVRKKRKNSIEE